VPVKTTGKLLDRVNAMLEERYGIVGVAVRKLELNGAVDDPISLLEHGVHAVEQLAGGLDRDVADHQMAGERRPRRAQGPDVEVMHAVDAFDGRDRLRDGFRVDAARSAFEKQ